MLYHFFASFKQSPIDFFKLVDSRLILMLLYDSLNLIISEIHQSYLSCWGDRSEKVKLRSLDCVKLCQCAVLLKLFSAMYLVAINILLRWQNTSIMLSIDMQSCLMKKNFNSWHSAQAP